ncbi:MAG TPA: nucleoside hydrolase [Dehalococcoidia bacterium]
MTRIHLDTDLGGNPDDLAALAYLLARPDVELTGITTVAERGGLRAGMVEQALRLAGRAGVPVAAGAEGSLGGFRWPPRLGEPSRSWPEPVEPRPGPPGAALDLLERSIRRGAVVLATGPATNLALLEAARPGLLARTAVVFMGGYRTGEPPPAGRGPETDTNVQQDTAAARLLIERVAPLLVPLAVTTQVPLRAAHLPRLRSGGPLAALLARQAEHYAAEAGRPAGPASGDLLGYLHDPLAAAVATGWDGLTVERLTVVPEVRDGLLTLRPDPAGSPVRLVTAVDAERFLAAWLAAVAPAGG